MPDISFLILLNKTNFKYLEFNRLVKSLNGISKNEFVQQINKIGALKKLGEIRKPRRQNTIHFYIDDDWFELDISSELLMTQKPVNSLDSKLIDQLDPGPNPWH